MAAAPTELDEATKQRLADEVEHLVRMGEDRKKARRIVWDDYLDELAAYAAPAPVKPEPPQPEPSPPETPVPEPPAVTQPLHVPSRQRFWSAADEVAMTSEQLQKNRAKLAKVKRLVGLRIKR